MHANPKPLNHRQYQSRALSASPSPPPIPPQPNRIQYENNNPKNEKLSFDIPLPPRRRYQIVPIREETNQSINRNSASTQPNLTSFAKSMYNNRNSSNKRNDYENIRDIIKPIVVKDPRRKPYYYNELSQSLDVNDITNDIPNIDSDSVDVNANNYNNNNSVKLQSEQISIENKNEKTIPRNYNSNSTINCGSGGSLDNII